MLKKLVYLGIFIIFFLIYFKTLSFLWTRFAPFNTASDIISVFILIFVDIPLSVISTEIIFKIIKKEEL